MNTEDSTFYGFVIGSGTADAPGFCEQYGFERDSRGNSAGNV